MYAHQIVVFYVAFFQAGAYGAKIFLEPIEFNSVLFLFILNKDQAFWTVVNDDILFFLA